MSTEIKDMVQNIGDEFAEFKTKNDERLKAIEEKGYAPADLEETVQKMSEGLCDLESKQEQLVTALNRVQGGEIKSEEDIKKAEVKAATLDYLHTGNVADCLKELSVGSDPNGGYTVFPEIADMVMAYAAEVRPIYGKPLLMPAMRPLARMLVSLTRAPRLIRQYSSTSAFRFMKSMQSLC
jgi:HK97 family phage major capsid protein